MYEKKVGKAYGRGCLLSFGTAAVGMVLGVAMVTTVLVLIHGGDVEPRSGRLALALLVPFVFIGALLAIAALFVALRGRRLDRAFAQWGLQGRQSGGVLRGWHGELDGRAFDAWFHKGPTLELYLSCAPRTRGVIHRGGPLIQAISRAIESRRPIEPAPVELEGASFYADDSQWLSRLLAGPEAMSALHRLMTETRRTATAISFAPNAVRYIRRFMPVSEVSPENLRLWTAQLAKLAAEIDRLGPASNGAEPTRLEEWARLRRGRFLNRFYLVLGGILVLTLGALFLFGWLRIGQV